MRIGVLTYHSSLNFGAALQAYALQMTLRQLGGAPEVIDYRNAAIEERKALVATARHSGGSAKAVTRAAVLSPLMGLKQRAFKRFYRDHLSMGKAIFTTPAQINESPPSYDRYLIGSDQVWNHRLNGSDPTYFAHFVSDRSRVATYAASFGLDEIPLEHSNFYREGIDSIPRISMREPLGAELVHQLTGREAHVHPDPVFLLSAPEWRRLASSARNDHFSMGLTTYFLDRETLARSCEYTAKQPLSGLAQTKLAGGIRLREVFASRVSVRYDRGPREFLRAIDDAAFVLTDSFHATALSIILDRPFGVILKGDVGKDSRILSLLEEFGLKSRVLTQGSTPQITKPSEASPTDVLLTAWRAGPREYLSELISGHPNQGP